MNELLKEIKMVNIKLYNNHSELHASIQLPADYMKGKNKITNVELFEMISKFENSDEYKILKKNNLI